MFRLKERPAIRAIDYIEYHPNELLGAQHEAADLLAVSAAVFRTVNGKSYLLALRRAATDSKPDHWELPGGGVDVDDTSLIAAISRELKEETGLTMSWVTKEVGHGRRWGKSWDASGSKTILCVTFIVETAEIELLERGANEGKGDGVKVEEPNLSSGQAGHEPVAATPTRSAPNSTIDTHHALEAVDIKLSATEHSRYLWLTKEAVQTSLTSDSEALRFTSRETREVMLEAFDLQEQIQQVRASLSKDV